MPIVIDKPLGNAKLEMNEWVVRHRDALKGHSAEEMCQILTALKLASKVIFLELSRNGSFTLGTIREEPSIETFANNKVSDALRNRQVVAGFATSLSDDIVDCGAACHNKRYVAIVHALDGTSSGFNNIMANVSVGTVFSIYERVSPLGGPVTRADFLQAGKNIVAAGYFMYGTSTMCVMSVGAHMGVCGFTLDPSLGTYYLSHPNMHMPHDGKIYSIDGGKRRFFPNPINEYIDHCQEKGFSLRYIGSFIADAHRNLLKGGIFLYPPTYTDPKPSVSMIFQCVPLAFLTEAAGGKATDGFTSILDMVPEELFDRVPFICGSTAMVDHASSLLQKAGAASWGEHSKRPIRAHSVA
eukprot:GDKI01026714.1.p1 GENE.GDKI01026714.1~~GDKI01026714.1.p1  ORF type:complete len:355 (+),score=104.45 GDKI01026714.1:66-1130(+)